MTKKRASGVKGKVQIGPYLDPALVESLRRSAAENRRGLSEEVQVALEFYLAHGDESAARKLMRALEKEGIQAG